MAHNRSGWKRMKEELICWRNLQDSVEDRYTDKSVYPGERERRGQKRVGLCTYKNWLLDMVFHSPYVNLCEFSCAAWSSWAWSYWLCSSLKHTTDHWSLNAVHVLHFDNLSHLVDLNKEVTQLFWDFKIIRRETVCSKLNIKTSRSEECAAKVASCSPTFPI